MVEILNNIIQKFADVIVSILNLLPDSPFTWVDLSQYPGWAWVNYFIPFDQMLGIMATYVVAVVSWYAVQWALRWAKYIQ